MKPTSTVTATKPDFFETYGVADMVEDMLIMLYRLNIKSADEASDIFAEEMGEIYCSDCTEERDHCQCGDDGPDYEIDGDYEYDCWKDQQAEETVG